MLFTKAALIFSSLILLAAAQDADASSKGLSPGRGRTPNPTSTKTMFKRDLIKRCTGSCEECFGSGYTLCPGSSIFCYLPGDSSYGLDSCTNDGSSGTTPTASAPASTSTSGSTGIDDLCYQTGATCQSCFGSSYIECPDGYHCYDPTDPQYDTCPDDSTGSGGSGGSSSGGATTTESCAEKWGDGNIPCGTDGCYDPTIGETCCSDGCKLNHASIYPRLNTNTSLTNPVYCDSGYSCSATIAKCDYDGGSLTGSSSRTTSSYSYTYGYSSYSYSSYSYPTSTSSYIFSTAASTTADSFGSSASSTSINSVSGSGGNVVAVEVGWGLLVAAGVGAFVL